jgi:hypothetical protein
MAGIVGDWGVEGDTLNQGCADGGVVAFSAT